MTQALRIPALPMVGCPTQIPPTRASPTPALPTQVRRTRAPPTPGPPTQVRGDAGLADSGPPDAGPADSGPADSGSPDAGPPDAGPPDAGPTDAGPVVHTLTVTVVGSGTVASTPPGIACPGACAASFDEGSIVSLAPTADTGWGFAGWSGACTATTGDCVVTMDAANAVEATFTVLPLVNLLSNPGFEASSSPTGWSFSASMFGDFSITTSNVHGGSRAARVVGDSMLAPTVALYPSSAPVPVSEAGAAYCATSWVAGNGSRVSLVIREGTGGSPTDVSSAEVVTTSTWQQLAVATTAQGGDPLTVRVVMLVTGGGDRMTVDDVQLWRSVSLQCPER